MFVLRNMVFLVTIKDPYFYSNYIKFNGKCSKNNKYNSQGLSSNKIFILIKDH